MRFESFLLLLDMDGRLRAVDLAGGRRYTVSRLREETRRTAP
jgi:hypothetical protein